MPQRESSSEPTAPPSTLELVEEGLKAFLSGEVSRAETLAQEAIDADPSLVDAWVLKGRTLVYRRDANAAMSCFDQALELDEGCSEAWRRKGLAHRVNGELEEAISCWNRAFNLGPGDHRILLEIGSALDELGDFAGALGYYERAIEINPDDPYAKESIRLNRQIMERLKETDHGGNKA